MADKTSALAWRILSRDRAEEADDPSIIRHLYDLHELSGQVQDFDKILQEAKTRYQRDQRRSSEYIPESLDDAMKSAISILQKDSLYEAEYNQYVLNMCFGKETPPSFEKALKAFSSLSE